MGMKNPDEKIIDDPKVSYLVHTLSRTNRKDYENYVVNAIWNRLNDDKIEIVTQQYIYDRKKRKHYFIDLYFPALNMGIECDEAHHLNEENIKLDKEREASIYDALHEIDSDGYTPIHIDVTRTYEEVQRQIDNAVQKIGEKIKEKKDKNELDEWKIQKAEEYYRKESEITIYDRVGFKSMKQACNILFATGYMETSTGREKTCFTPRRKIFLKSKYKDYKVWFPQLAIRDENNELIAATKTGWNNQLINNGKELIEDNDNEKLGSKHDLKKRIVFAKYKDQLGDYGYKFVGIFELAPDYKGGKRCYHREEDKCKILRE